MTLLPFDPIIEEVRRRTWPLEPTHDEIAVVCGILPRRWARMKQRGGLTVWEADELASALGRHAGSMWPDDDPFMPSWEQAIDAEIDRLDLDRKDRALAERQAVSA